MLAVFVNCGTVILGSLIGLLLSGKKNDELEKVITSAAGLVTLVIGFQMAFTYENIIYLSLALILGGIVGTLSNIDGKILLFGSMLEKLLYHKKIAKQTDSEKPKPSFAYAFLNASVLFCVGAMSILGSFQAGISNDYSVIFTKSVLDGFMAIVFAAALGIGTAFSAIVIFVYQGSLTLLSTLVEPYVSEQMLTEITASGGVLIAMIGFNVIGLTKLKTANYLPAILFSVLFVLLDPYITQLASNF